MIMNKRIKLDNKDISSLINKLQVLKSDLKKLPHEINKEIAEIGLEYLNNEFANTRTDHTIDINSIETDIVETTKGYSIVAKGSEVLYAEFGTGEYGQDNPHPLKQEFDLNPYNSGPIVSTHINKNGRHYWFYDNQYSEGNASGKQMFNTSKYLREKVIKEVVKEKVGEVISKV